MSDRAPKCAECHVNAVKWCPRTKRWRTYCDRICAGQAVSRRRDPVRQAEVAARLRGYLLARRRQRVEAQVVAFLAGRTEIPARELYQFAHVMEQAGWHRGYATGWHQQKRRRHAADDGPDVRVSDLDRAGAADLP